MVRAEIEQAIRNETPLAWASRGVPRQGAWPRGAYKVVPLEIRGGGRVRVRRCDGGDGWVARSRDLMTDWGSYAKVRERIEEEYREQREQRDELDRRIDAVAVALGGGTTWGRGLYQAPGAVRRESVQGVWMPIELAEQIVAALETLRRPGVAELLVSHGDG